MIAYNTIDEESRVPKAIEINRKSRNNTYKLRKANTKNEAERKCLIIVKALNFYRAYYDNII